MFHATPLEVRCALRVVPCARLMAGDRIIYLSGTLQCVVRQAQSLREACFMVASSCPRSTRSSRRTSCCSRYLRVPKRTLPCLTGVAVLPVRSPTVDLRRTRAFA